MCTEVNETKWLGTDNSILPVFNFSSEYPYSSPQDIRTGIYFLDAFLGYVGSSRLVGRVGEVRELESKMVGWGGGIGGSGGDRGKVCESRDGCCILAWCWSFDRRRAR